MKISEEIRGILADCSVGLDGTVYLPEVQLDRKVYLEVNKVLEAIGGKWNRKVKGHVFETSPLQKLEEIVLTGEYTDAKKEFQFFETPEELAVKLCDMAEITPDCIVIEPSCGKGRIVREIEKRNPKHLICIEKNEELKPHHSLFKFAVMYGDFLEVEGYAADRIVMNPPFSKLQDIDHVMKAYELLNSDGIVVSVMSTSPFYRQDKQAVAFREFLETNNAEVEDLPEGTFKESGTMVNTCVVKIRKV